MEKKYNLNQLVSIEVFDKYVSDKYDYLPYNYKKNWLGKVTETIEGIYGDLPNSYQYGLLCIPEYFNKTALSDKHIVVDETVYVKPMVLLKFSNGELKRIYYNTIETARMKANDIEFKSGHTLWLKD